jgi:hypothetical protein
MAQTFTGQTVLQLDDNLSNGRTYTFQFKSENWFINPSVDDVQNDIYTAAPDFITSLQVTSPFTTSLYNVQFTYEGDGSDVVSDVAMSIVAAIKATSNDNMTFVGAVSAAAADIAVSPIVAVQVTEKAISGAVTKVATDATQAATDTINTALKGLLPLLAVAVLIILFVLPSFVKSTGARVSVGG